MSDSVQKFFLDDSFLEKKEENINKDVLHIIELFRLLSVEDKIVTKRLISQENLWI